MTELWKPIVNFLNALLKSEQNGAIWAPLGLSLLPYLPPPFSNRPYFRDFLWYLKCQEEWGAGKGGWSECACCFFTGQFERTIVIRQDNFIVFLLDTQPEGWCGDSCWLWTRSPKRESLPNHTTKETFKIRYCFFGNPSRLRWKRFGPFFFREIFGLFQAQIPFCSNKPCYHPRYWLSMIT